jgi:hypothetical protein
MTMLQVTSSINSTKRVLGVTFTAIEGTSPTLTFNYPTSGRNDLIVAYVVTENKIIPDLPNGWSSIYSNTTDILANTGSGRLLMYTRSNGEMNASINVVGGGCVSCISLRNYKGEFESVTEYGLEKGPTSNNYKRFVYTNGLMNTFITMTGMDPNLTTSNDIIINVTGFRTTISNTSNNFKRNMSIGYTANATSVTGANANVSINSLTDGAFGIYYKIT